MSENEYREQIKQLWDEIREINRKIAEGDRREALRKATARAGDKP